MPRRHFRRRFRPRRGRRRFALKRAVRGTWFRTKENFLWAGVLNTASNAAIELSPTLNMIDATRLAAFQGLFQRYMITGVKFKFIPRYQGSDYNQAVANVGGALGYGGQHQLFYVSVRTDQASATSATDALARPDCRVVTFPAGKPRSFYESRPTWSMDIVDGAGTDTTYHRGQIDALDGVAVPHFCSLFWMSTEGTGSQPYTIVCSMYITWSDPLS